MEKRLTAFPKTGRLVTSCRGGAHSSPAVLGPRRNIEAATVLKWRWHANVIRCDRALKRGCGAIRQGPRRVAERGGLVGPGCPFDWALWIANATWGFQVIARSHSIFEFEMALSRNVASSSAATSIVRGGSARHRHFGPCGKSANIFGRRVVHSRALDLALPRRGGNDGAYFAIGDSGDPLDAGIAENPDIEQENSARPCRNTRNPVGKRR